MLLKNVDTRKHTDLHNYVKGKVQQQVADGDGQQVGGKVIRSHYEAEGSSVDREQGHDVSIYSCHVNVHRQGKEETLTETS